MGGDGVPGKGASSRIVVLNRVQLFATLRTVARQAPLSMGFSRSWEPTAPLDPLLGSLSLCSSNHSTLSTLGLRIAEALYCF